MINKTCPLVLSQCYEYDFTACGYRILKNIGWDLSGIDFENKEKRNIQIGLIQRDNPKIARFIHDSVNSLIDNYLIENNIGEDELILRQFDGVTVTKKFKILNSSLPIKLTSVISKLIISFDRKKWMKINDKVVVKGLSHTPIDCSFYNLFQNLNFTNKKILVDQLETIRINIYKYPKIEWFVFEDEDDTFSVPIIDEGFLSFRRSSLSILKKSDLDCRYIWSEFVWPFIESIILTI
jgi:hypothetical protein